MRTAMIFHHCFVTAYTAARLHDVQHQQLGRDLARVQRLTRRADRMTARARLAADRLL
jgi:hypothetical protein